MEKPNQESFYEVKYQLLSRRCTEIEQDNDRLLNLLYSTRKYLSRAKKKKFLLMKALSKHEDVRNLEFSRLHGVEEEKEVAIKKDKKVKIKKEPNLSSSQTDVKGKTDITASSSKKKKKKKQVSGEAVNGAHPKKPMNAYLLFCQVNRPLIQEEHHSAEGMEMNNNDITKTLATKWKALTDSERDVFQKMYDADKLRYDQEVKIFNTNQKLLQVKNEPIDAELKDL
jgi:non-histone protein 10